MKRWNIRLGAVLAAVGVLTASCPVGATLLYDTESGENPEELLAEDESVWETVATPAAALAVEAKGAVLMDQGSGTVLYEKDAKKHLPIASVTKIMTLLLVVEAIDAGKLRWEDTVTCSERAASLGGSQIWLEPGETMTVEELVKAAAVVSANDACAALGEHISGTIESFVGAMNERAEQLGMEDTRFADCSGLDDSGYSCALDVAKMARELMTHSEIERFTTIWMDTLRGGKSQLVNTNKLLRHYTGITGLKTGTTQAAGHCLAATAVRENTGFIAVVLGCATTKGRFNEARAMLDYGFSNYVSFDPASVVPELIELPVAGGQEQTAALTADIPQTVLLKKGAEKQITVAVETEPSLTAPVEKGQIVGTWRLTAAGETVGEYPIRAACAVGEKTFRWAYGLLFSALIG